MLRPALLAILTLALLLSARLHAASSRPNVIIFYADDLGWGEISAQGFSKDIPTPNIDSLAQNGLRFTNGYVAATYCSPARACTPISITSATRKTRSNKRAESLPRRK